MVQSRSVLAWAGFAFFMDFTSYGGLLILIFGDVFMGFPVGFSVSALAWGGLKGNGAGLFVQ